MWSMRLQHHISNAAILLRSALFRVQVSKAYKAIIGNTRAWKNLTFVVLVIPLSAQILDRFVIAERAIANRCLISWLQPLSLVIRDPRKLILETNSTSLPSIMRGSSTLSEPMAMICVSLKLRRRPRSSLFILTLFKSSTMSATMSTMSAKVVNIVTTNWQAPWPIPHSTSHYIFCIQSGKALSKKGSTQMRIFLILSKSFPK